MYTFGRLKHHGFTPSAPLGLLQAFKTIYRNGERFIAIGINADTDVFEKPTQCKLIFTVLTEDFGVHIPLGNADDLAQAIKLIIENVDSLHGYQLALSDIKLLDELLKIATYFLETGLSLQEMKKAMAYE